MASTMEAKPNHPVSAKLENMDDFIKDQEAHDAARAPEMDNQQSKSKKDDPVVDINSVTAEDKAIRDFGTRNWIGMLLEYRQSHKVGSALAGEGLSYQETIIGSPPHRFTCTVSIAESPDPLGGGVSFVLKKNARRYAAKKAVEWLIEKNLMPNDGAVNFPKPPSPQQANQTKILSDGIDSWTTTAPNSTSPPPSGPSWAAMVPPLCYKLGLNIPSYSITQKSSEPLWDVYADFGDGSIIKGKVGQVENVFGKKNAKEASAKLTVGFLQNIEKQRNEIYEEEDRKRKRDAASSNSSSEEEGGGEEDQEEEEGGEEEDQEEEEEDGVGVGERKAVDRYFLQELGDFGRIS